jgi:CheY-like chemotaxis protein
LSGEAVTIDVRTDAGDASERVAEPALYKESASFLSTHLLRELIAADARCDGGIDDPAAHADALLAAVLVGLELGEGAIVRAEPDGVGTCLAVRGIPDHARQLLEGRAALEQLGPSLLQRALTERRVLLLDRTTREPLMPALRDGNPDVECAVIVPLADRDLAVGVLLLAARGRKLSAPYLRSLAVAFRLLGMLLAPRRGAAAPAPAPVDEHHASAAEGERYLFEIEELTARLAEARETAQRQQDRASSAETALRADLESARARVAELEAELASAAAPGRELELEALCAEQACRIEEHERRVAELEGEVTLLVERTARRDGDGWGEAALQDATLLDGADSESVETIELEESGDEQLGDIAAAAAAAIDGDELGVGEDDGAPLVDDEETVTLEDDGTTLEPVELVDAADDEVVVETTAIDALEEVAGSSDADVAAPSAAYAVLHVEGRAAACELARAAADDVGAAYWCDDGDLPVADKTVVAVNLLDEALSRLARSQSNLWEAARWIVYGAADGNIGFEVPSCGLVRRPLDPRGCLEQLHRAAGRKPTGTLLVSAQLREVAGLRHALQEADIAGSVACDVRQALDLLEIVRRPDVILIDLALPQGQALALVGQLRRQPETASLPLLLLLPPDPDPVRLHSEADKAQMLGAFGDEDVQRLVRAVLAGRA